MKTLNILLCCFLCLCVHTVYPQAPLEFVENRGQWGDWLKYKVTTQGGSICLESDGFRYILADAGNSGKMDAYHHGRIQEKPLLKFHVYKTTFVGAKVSGISGNRPGETYYNYFLGDDTSRWRSGIHPCRGVTYGKLYPGVDMNVFSTGGHMEYEFIVRSQANANQIKVKFDGQDYVKIIDHNLIISTSIGQMVEQKPYAYQYISGEKVEVACEYQLKGNELTYAFPEDYDHNEQLIIDPVVVLCTLSGSTSDNWGYSATYDDAGNFYAGGLVNDFEYGGHFPVSPGAFQMIFGGGSTVIASGYLVGYAADISIIKFDPTLKNRIYATYLGGSGNDHVHSMIVDPSGNLIVAGRTISTNYPVTSGAFQTTNHGGWDIVATKFNAAGTALVGSTYLGGSGDDGVNYDSTEYYYGQLKYNYGDDARSEVQIDKSGNIYVAGCTSSGNFPTTATAISSTLSGMQDGVVVKLNSSLTSLIWSTYLGGSGSDASYVLAFDTSQQSVYIAGGTNSTNFPTTAGAWHSTYQGGLADGFVTKFKNSTPYNILNSSYVGTSNYDQVFGVQVSNNNEVYLMGQSLGGAFPVTSGVHSNPSSNQFVMKMDNPLTSNLISTVYGSGSSPKTNISPNAFMVDTCENVYISGWGGNLGFSTISSGGCTGMEVTSDATQPTTDGTDFYFIVFGPGLASLRYASFYGRSCSMAGHGEHVDGGTSRFDKHGIIYQGICANCGGVYSATSTSACPAPFPTTKGVWSEVDSSKENCNEAALKIAFNIGPVKADVTAGPSTTGCAPLTVNFTNTSNNALTYVWDFGDGTPGATSYSPTHTFMAGGTYTVTLSAANSNACFKTNDTARLIIVVDTNYINPSFTYKLTDSCGPFIASINNTSVTHTASGTSSYNWFFGDGGTYAGDTPPPHNYPDTGSYTVTLVMDNPGACKRPDTVVQKLHIYYLRVTGHFSAPDSVCKGANFSLNAGGTNVNNRFWDFGNGHTSTAGETGFHYDSVGVYTITYIAQNAGTCNGADTLTRTIKVLPIPAANFSFAPLVPIENIPTTFTNLSVNAVRYEWDFGDNASSVEVNPVHQYEKTGAYKTCLHAFNISNCPSVICKQVSAEVVPHIGLPTGFSPNGDGENDVLYVRGAAIKTLDLKIFNRWGQLIFETTSQQKGWDGSYNGQPQPIEAYAYVLDVTFIDGTARLLKGNITLLR